MAAVKVGCLGVTTCDYMSCCTVFLKLASPMLILRGLLFACVRLACICFGSLLAVLGRFFASTLAEFFCSAPLFRDLPSSSWVRVRVDLKLF